MAPLEQHLSPTQAADRLGDGAEHVRVLCRLYEADRHHGLGQVKGPGPNGRIRIPESAITEWANRRTYHPGPR